MRPMTLDDIMAIRQIGFVALSPDGMLVAYSVTAWEHPNAKAGGASPAGDSAKSVSIAADVSLGDRHDLRSHLWLVAASRNEAAVSANASMRKHVMACAPVSLAVEIEL